MLNIMSLICRVCICVCGRWPVFCITTVSCQFVCHERHVPVLGLLAVPIVDTHRDALLGSPGARAGLYCDTRPALLLPARTCIPMSDWMVLLAAQEERVVQMSDPILSINDDPLPLPWGHLMT